MSTDIWLIAELTISGEKNEVFRERMKTLIELVRSKEPDTLLFECYFNEDETKCYPFELYRDSRALQIHLKNVKKVFENILEVAELTRLDVYGNATKELKMDLAPLGAKMFKHWTGFTR
jgi:quinol monooxygenase YgiN